MTFARGVLRLRGCAPMAAMAVVLAGCQTPHSKLSQPKPVTSAKPVACRLPPAEATPPAGVKEPPIELPPNKGKEVVMASATYLDDGVLERPDVADYVSEALAVNPQVQRLEAEAAAAWARVPQVRALPDPMAGGTVFGEPQRMGGGEMRGTFMVSQRFPSFKQLDARGRQAAFEALLAEQEARSARLRVAADVEEAWYRLYLLGQLLRINEANRQLISPLVDVATGRVEVGEASPGDVVLGTLELSRTEEERLMLEQQLASRKAILNRWLNRPSDAELPVPEAVDELSLAHSLEELRSVTFQQQPAIVAARLRTEATAWGVRVARLERIPEVDLSYEHMFMKMNPGEEGSDPWRVGVDMNIPLWHRKYRAIEREARQENLAAHQGVEEALREYDAMLLDLVEQARAAERTTRLYRDTIMPQTRQALEVDQRAYGQGTVDFDRVIDDARNLLAAEAAYYRSLVEGAIAVVRLKQATGGQLPPGVEELRQPESLPTP